MQRSVDMIGACERIRLADDEPGDETMSGMIYETTCGEWDIISLCDGEGFCECITGFVSEQSAVEHMRLIGWRMAGVVRLQYIA